MNLRVMRIEVHLNLLIDGSQEDPDNDFLVEFEIERSRRVMPTDCYG